MSEKNTEEIENTEEILKELKEYEKNNVTLAKYKSPLVFENSDLPHASIVMKNIVNFSEREVMIYDRDLSGDLTVGDTLDENAPVWSDKSDDNAAEERLNEFKKEKRSELLDSFERHLKKGKNLFIVVDNANPEESVIYRKLAEWEKSFPFFLSVTEASKNFKEAVGNLQDSKGRKISYMAVGDMTSYRVQIRTSEDQQSNGSGLAQTFGRSAFVCYNDVETAKKLGKVFKDHLTKESIFQLRAKP